MKKKLFSIIIPVYGNEKNLPITIPYVMEHLHLFPHYDVEVIMVCDGSPDDSWTVMKQLKEKYTDIIRIIRLNRRYSQKVAVLCGFEQAKGDVIGTIAADLQEPFELFVEMLKKYEEGFEVVVGYRNDREDSKANAWFAKTFHGMLHKLNNKYPLGGFDIFLINSSLRPVYAKHVLNWGSPQFGLIGMTDSIAYVGYTRKKREIGKSGFSIKRKLYIVMTTLVLNTDAFFLFLTGLGSVLSVFFLVFSVVVAFVGWPFNIVMLGIVSAVLGVVIMGIGMLGICVYNWAQNLRGLPKYLIAEEY